MLLRLIAESSRVESSRAGEAHQLIVYVVVVLFCFVVMILLLSADTIYIHIPYRGACSVS